MYQTKKRETNIMPRWNAKLSDYESKRRTRALTAWVEDCKQVRLKQIDEWRAEFNAYTSKWSALPDPKLVCYPPEDPVTTTNFYDFVRARFVEDFEVVEEDDFCFVFTVFNILKDVRTPDPAAIFYPNFLESNDMADSRSVLQALHVFCN